MRYASVALDGSIDRLLDYSIPEELEGKVQIGMRVLVPVKSTTKGATVWSIKKETLLPSVREIKEIALEDSVITKDLALLAEWIALYYAAPLSKVLKNILPKHIRSHEKEQTELVVTLKENVEEGQRLLQLLEKKAPKQAAFLATALQEKKPTPLRVLLQKAQTGRDAANALARKGIISLDFAPKVSVEDFSAEYFRSPAKTLSEEQEACFLSISEGMEKKAFVSHLLYGVTGSGKTEIYLQAMEKALAEDLGVIFLVPEIALAMQTLERIKSRFAEKVAVLHHRLSEGEKKESWHAIHSGEAKIIVGARSAIFCPVPNLGLIIVDEEHESAYKQMDKSPHYHGRDVAIMRAKFAKATVILGSATPSMESYQNALAGKHLLSILSKRPDSATLPKVHIVDMHRENDKQKRKALFSDPLLSAIKKRLELGEQTLLLLNRRGYHTAQVCPSCAEPTKCIHCDAVLTYHRDESILCCHLCGYETPPLRSCKKCPAGAPMKFKGAGTQMAEKALQAIFPSSRILRMDADTTKRKHSHETLFKQFRSGKADILIGTQMIAKGLHFPSVTLVGVLDADVTLNIPDFRASESLFQLVTQVAGRAGRSDLPGEVFIQTLMPNGSTLLLAAEQNYDAFFTEEKESRKLFAFPPFTHLIKVVFAGESEEKTKHTIERGRKELIFSLPSSFEILPVAPCGYAKVENQYRFQFLIKTAKPFTASRALLEMERRFMRKNLRINIDIDPASTFF